MELGGKVFVVTGGGNGIGRQVALGLLARGARVAAVDLDDNGLAETARLSGAAPDRLSVHTANIADREAVQALAADVVATHGHVDGVANIAGIIHRFARFTELTVEEAERIMDVNFWGTVHMCRTFLPLLRERPTASLVNMSSLAALIPFASQTFYGASKGAVKQFSEGLHGELLGTGVTVTTVFPGNISTNLTGNSGVKMIDPGGRKVRSTTPEEAGRTIVAGIEKGSFRVLVGADARLLDRLVRLNARWATRLVARQMNSVL
ncbi:SDR family NAD(P)-dependent oxidoreductase [Streptomyces collinus]|uniref:SDR family NAD(P)-dependent oxidoreductase n=1 Tax=Streptomyces collinus TaxID=42684 RepID=UPI00367C85C5